MAVQMKPCRLFLVQENVQFHRADPTLGNRGPSVAGFPRVDRADVTTSISGEYGVRRNAVEIIFSLSDGPRHSMGIINLFIVPSVPGFPARQAAKADGRAPLLIQEGPDHSATGVVTGA